ncbi:MAG: hypothetical protein JXB88_17790 [Spirochaetales bacterium]|nr:hypothetical protein [Spirochaetales bacterium]
MKKNRKRNQQKRMQNKRTQRRKGKKRESSLRWITDDMFAFYLDNEDINRLFSSIIIRKLGPDEDEDFPDGDVSFS